MWALGAVCRDTNPPVPPPYLHPLSSPWVFSAKPIFILSIVQIISPAGCHGSQNLMHHVSGQSANTIQCGPIKSQSKQVPLARLARLACLTRLACRGPDRMTMHSYNSVQGRNGQPVALLSISPHIGPSSRTFTSVRWAQSSALC